MTDADQFEAFVRRYQDMVFATALRLLGNAADAEDIAQTVFLKAFQRFDEIARSPSAAGWLKTVTRNGCLNHLSRYRARWRFFSELDTSDSDGASTSFASTLVSGDSPAAALEQAFEHAQIERALLTLPDHQRIPLVLFHFERASYQEIADTLGVSLGKVKTDIHRGREALGRTLATLRYRSRTNESR
jgi:RNA polymerase sigma-70 factor (ECF subfamily)